METIAAHRHMAQMAVFAHVVEHKSFSRAATALAISKSAVSKHIARLETRLGATLLNRTTRTLSLTDDGAKYYESCSRILAEVARAENAIAESRHQPTGTLRINAPTAYGSARIAPLVGEFLRPYEHLQVELTLQDDYVDLIENGIDLAIRIGHRLADTRLIARKVASIPVVLCASPAYLARAGRPTAHTDLRSHECILYSLAPARAVLTRNGRRYRVALQGRVRTNSGAAMRSAAAAGHGIAMLPDFYVAEDLASGALVPILERYDVRPVTAFAVLPPSRNASPKVKLFGDFLAARLSST